MILTRTGGICFGEIFGTHGGGGSIVFFKFKWELNEDATFEPAGKFFMRFNGPLINHGLDHNVDMDIFQELKDVPCE